MAETNEIRTMIDSAVAFSREIAEWVLFRDSVNNPKFIEWLDARYEELNGRLKQINDGSKKGIDYGELAYLTEKLDGIGYFVAVARNMKPDNGMSKNDCRVKMLKDFLCYCCNWNDNKLKHISVHTKDDREEAVGDDLAHIRNAIAAINEAEELIGEAKDELHEAGVVALDFEFGSVCTDIEVGYGIESLVRELTDEDPEKDDITSVTYKGIRFKEIR